LKSALKQYVGKQIPKISPETIYSEKNPEISPETIHKEKKS